ncbi:MAG: Phosphoenolpyruvate-protein phosphotransferase [Chlamydiales bacterium]|nr:Phosphoenolpyruvate-protein phosphotransferase [Chlamydiales bacterium]
MKGELLATKKNVGSELTLQGYPICPGIAIGRPFYFAVAEENIPEFCIPDDKIDHEVDRYYSALKSSRTDLVTLQQRLQKEGGNEAAAILGAHLEIMHDPLMTVEMEEAIRERGKNTEYVFKSVIGEYEKKFYRVTDEFFKERLKDVQDLSRRIIGHLRKHERYTLSQLVSRFIVFAHEILPSDTAEANTDVIDAFVTRSGSETSHVAIMARAKGIPFVSNVDFPDLTIAVPPLVIVDGCSGQVIINPHKETLKHFRAEQKKMKIKAKGLQNAGSLETETIDGYRTCLSANVERANDLDALIAGEGVGLYRSEYLFLACEGFPPEEEQFMAYRSLAEKVDGHSSVVRTFDIGGDKLANFNVSRHEDNPYLGCRAIRLMLKEPTVFKTQLRAILRASAFGELSILFPMISGVSELREAKALVEEAKEELLQRGIPFARNIQIGCMVEVPSAAITADILSKECDFLSIGTNDLVQYSLAVDRGNPSMSYLYTPAHPSIIRMIKMVVDEGIKAGIPVSVCGEIAADPRFTPLLLGLGIHELSVNAQSIPYMKNVIRHLKIVEARALAVEVLKCETPVEVEGILEKAFQKIFPYL